MARYDREFLVPFLEDICALQLSKRKLEDMVGSYKQQIYEINQNAIQSVAPLKLERYKEPGELVFDGWGCLSLVCSLFTIVLFFASLGSSSPAGLLLPGMFAVPTFILFGKMLTARDRANSEIKTRNDEKERNYAIAKIAALTVAEPKVNEIKQKIDFNEKEITKIDDVLEKLYSVNVIPRWYRDLYPAVYLYDWFSNSRADDLDIALNTLVLEQIKDKLDVIIRNQSEMIINQRIMIANQRKTMEQMERHHNEMIRKLNQIGASVEDQKMYLGMIEGNTAANAYFAAANYLKR